MGLRVGVGLPGPFSYSVDAGKAGKKSGHGLGWILVGPVLLIWWCLKYTFIGIWWLFFKLPMLAIRNRHEIVAWCTRFGNRSAHAWESTARRARNRDSSRHAA